MKTEFKKSSTDASQVSKTEMSWWEKIQLLHGIPLSELHNELLSTLSTIYQNGDDTASEMYNIAKTTLQKVLGCAHAVVDVSAPLGKQTIGMALFVTHSFFNHCCSPNAYITSIIPVSQDDDGEDHPHNKKKILTARVHLIRPVKKAEPITLSYIPLSGLSVQERQMMLSKYGFTCDCESCSNPEPLVLPADADIDPIREIQYRCNEQLIEIQNNTGHKANQDDDDDRC